MLADLRAQRDATEAQRRAAVQDLAIERDAGARRLDALERQLTDLSGALSVLTGPVTGLPAQLTAVGQLVRDGTDQLHRDLMAAREADRSTLHAIVAPAQAQLSGLADQLTDHFRQQRRAARFRTRPGLSPGKHRWT